MAGAFWQRFRPRASNTVASRADSSSPVEGASSGGDGAAASVKAAAVSAPGGAERADEAAVVEPPAGGPPLVQVFFNPDIAPALIKAIRGARKAIWASVFCLDHTDIVAAMVHAIRGEPSLSAHLVLDRRQFENPSCSRRALES